MPTPTPKLMTDFLRCGLTNTLSRGHCEGTMRECYFDCDEIKLSSLGILKLAFQPGSFMSEQRPFIIKAVQWRFSQKSMEEPNLTIRVKSTLTSR